MAQALEGKKFNRIQLIPTHLHQQCSACLTEEIRIAGKKLLCLQDVGEGGGILLFSLLTKTRHSLLLHQIFGDP